MSFKLCLLLVAIGYVSAISYSEETSNRITNSPIAATDQFPYVISLQQLSQLPNYLQAHRCGGALITLQHSLTLATCVFNTVNNVPQLLNVTEYRVFAGAVLLSADSAERSRTIASFIAHPEHILQPSSVNDIALIITALPFLNTTVIPIQLPVANYIPADFTLCSVAGWGGINYSTTASNELRYANKYIYRNDTCTVLWNSNPTTANVLPSMICAASYDILSSGCYGDQGNSLVCNSQLTGLLFQSNVCQISSFPEVYTRVSNYVPWIRSITGAASTFRPEFGVLTLVALICMKILR